MADTSISLDRAVERVRTDPFMGVPSGNRQSGAGPKGGSPVGYNADGRKGGTPGNGPGKSGAQRSNPPAGVPNPKGM